MWWICPVFQFATTSIFHFFFVSLTVGLAFLIAVMETFAHVAVGVVTGIVQEFQSGMNRSECSRFVGDIFGVPLALEVLMAFFLESTFIGLWWRQRTGSSPGCAWRARCSWTACR